MNVKAFEPIELQYDTFDEIKQYINKELKPEQQQRLNDMIQLIDGFQSALALEILATVDYVKKEKSLTNEEDIIHAVQHWSNRKHNLFQEKHILIAIRHLEKYSTKMSLA